MNKLFVQWYAILSLLLMRKLFQTGSPCLPLPLNSKIHNPVQVTVIFGWHSQKFAYPEDKLCVPCPEVVSGLHQRSNSRATYEVQLTAESTRVFLAGKKRQWSWDCQKGFSAFSIAPRNSLPSLCFTGAIPTLWIFLLWFTFPSKDLIWVLLGSETDFWMPTLTLTDWYHWASSCSGSSFLYKDPASLERSFQGCEGPQDEPQTQETEGEASDHWLEHCLLVLATPERCLMSLG